MNKPPGVVQLGNKVIRSKAKNVSSVSDPEVQMVIRDLISVMRERNLVGLAAPQIGIGKRIFVTEVRTTTYRKNIAQPDKLRVFVNPKIRSHSKSTATEYEGCGSVAEAMLFGPVKRFYMVEVVAFNELGEEFVFQTNGFLARIIQHEMDHLDGIVFIDKVTDTRKLLGREEYIALRKKNV